MKDYREDILFRFSKTLFFIFIALGLFIIAAALSLDALPRAIQTGVILIVFTVASLLLFKYKKIGWFINLLMFFLLIQSALTAILVHYPGTFNYNFIFYGGIGYFFNYLQGNKKIGILWLSIFLSVFIFASINSYTNWVGEVITDGRKILAIQILPVPIGLVFSGLIFYYYTLYFEIQRSQISESQIEVDFLKNFQETLSNFTQTPIAILNETDRTIVFTNESFAADLGYRQEELIGQNINQFQYENLERDREEKKILDVHLKTKTGEEISRDIERNPFSANKTNYEAIFYYDSALRKEEEKRLRELIENLPVSVTQVSKEGEVIYTNQRMEEITGYPNEKIKNIRTFLKLVVPEKTYKDKIVQEHQQLMKGIGKGKNGRISGEFILKGGDGQIKHINSTILLFETFDVFILNDITTERNRQEELEKIISTRTKDLRNSEEKLRTVLNSITDLISYKDINGVFLECNEAFARITGKKMEEIIGKKDEDVYGSEEVAQAVKERDNYVFQHGVATINDHKGDFPDRTIFYSVIRTPFYDTEGKLAGVVNISRDITDVQKIVEKEREVNRLKSQFITMASHQFKTPLTVILASVELLNVYKDFLSEKMAEKINRQVKRITTETQRLNNLINDVLLLGKVEAERAELDLKETNLITWAEELIQSQFGTEPDNRTIEMTHTGTPTIVKIDEQMMAHVLSNLFSNALKYSKNCPSPQFNINYLADKIIFTVQDFGIGVPKEEQANLFQPFFRAANVGVVPGTGIGMVVVKEFVQVQKGDIQVNSIENEGTTIIITLPIV